MKKILSILILAVATIFSASATQVVKVVYSGTSQSITFRTNNVSATRIRYVRNTNTNPTFSNYTYVTPTNSGNYSTFSISSGNTNTTANKTIQIELDDAVTFFEISANQTYATSVTLSSATNLASVCLKGCTSLTTLTLGTMSALSDIDVSSTRAAVANAITATNCPNLENLNVANCGLSSLGYSGTGLYSLDITDNNITTLNLSSYSKLDILRCEGNTMTSLTLPSSVTTVSAQSNNLTGVTGFGEPLTILDVASNNLSSLSMSDITSLTDLDISSNHLTFRSFPSASNKPARMRYTGNDGTYDLSGQMRAAFGGYSYPLMSMLPNYAARNETTYTLDMTDCRLDGHGEQNVVPVINSYDGTTDTPLALSTSDVDGKDYAKSTDGNLYGFMKQQSRVRFSFTDATYPGLTLYSNDFTVPNGVTGTIEIVDEDGVTLYTQYNAVFSDATDGLPADARRDYTEYTCPAMPTTAGQTWTVTASPSADAPFAWAKTYETADWYYLSLKNKYATAGEQLYQLGGGQAYNGHKLKDTYDSSDNNYQWAFVGNQYDGFKIYNKGRGSGETLQDYSGYWTPTTDGLFPVMKSGESLTWIVRTNSSGTGFSLENKGGGTDNTNGGASAPCFLNDFEGRGAMNYWITSVYDAQNDAGSLFNVTYASGALSATINWVFKDGNGNAVYSLVESTEAGTTISNYTSAVNSLIANRFISLPALQSFTVASGVNRKEITYTWTGPFQISTTGNEHHYNLKMRSTRYLSSDTNSDGVLYMPDTAPAATDNAYRWMFFGDPFNGFTIRCYAKDSQELAAANGTATDGTSFPTFANEGEGSKWIVTSATRSGYTNPFSISPSNTSGVYWNQYSYWNSSTLSYGLKYWDHDGTGDAGACIEAVELPDPSTVYLTWNILDAAGNTKVTIEKEYTKNATVSEYPAEMTAYEDRFVAYPTLTSFTADRTKSVDVTYSWNGPFQLTTDTDNPHLYYFKSARYSYYAYAPNSSTGQAVQSSQTKNVVTPRGRWFFTGDPFDGIEIRPYAYPETGLVNNTLFTTPTKYIPKAAPDITTNYWNNAQPSAAISFVIPNSSNCLAEQLGTWSSASINSDKGLSFVVEEADDVSMLVENGYYRVRCMGDGLTSKYWKLDDQNGVKKLCNDGDPNEWNTVFRIEEQVNVSNGLPTYYIAGFYGTEAWYLDNTRTNLSQQFTATQTAEDYMPAEIIYNGKSGDIPFYAIKLSNQETNSGYSYANTNGTLTTVVTWAYTSGSADGSAWTFEPVELFEATQGDIYTINNLNANRGALTSDPTINHKFVWSSGKGGATAFDAESANCQWIFVPTAAPNQYCLYNVGKQKFIVPTQSGEYGGYSWMFSSDAVPFQLYLQSDGTYKICSVSDNIYLSVSNNYEGPIINYNDVGAQFTITKQGTASNAISTQLAQAMTAIPNGSNPMALNAVGGKSYATLYLDYDVQTDENTQAYYITEVENGNSAKLTAVGNEGRNIPAYTAVVLVNENGTTNPTFSAGFSVSNGYTEAIAEGTNLLKGTLTGMQLDLSSTSPNYSLGKYEGAIGFYKFDNNGTTTINLGANKAYLQYPAQSGVKGYALRFDTFDLETAIETTNSEPSSLNYYDLSGRRVTNHQIHKGIYIVNGRKIVK